MSRRYVLLASFAIAAIAASAPVLGALPVPPWSGENPGTAVDHASVAGPALEHDQALEDHLGPSGEHPGMPDGLPDQADDHAQEHAPLGTSVRDTNDDETGDADDEETDDAADDETDDADDVETASTLTPMHFSGNYTANGTVGSGTWDFANHTLNVSAGNFSWHGINCSWDAFTWSKGTNLSDVLNITCDFWGAFTITIDHGEVTITWSSGSWNHTLGAPIRPVEIAPSIAAGSAPAQSLAATRTAETRVASLSLPF